MHSRLIIRLAVAVTGSAAITMAPVTMAGAAAAPAAPDAAMAAPAAPAATDGGLLMVNGAGQTVTLPKTLAASLGASAGQSGKAPATGVAANKGQGGAGTDSVIGPDGRVQEWDPHGYPWRSIVHIESNQGGCTGFMLSRDVVVTAGHCVYDVAFGQGWVTSYRAIPGRNGGAEPYGSCSGGIADVWTTWNWISTGSPDYDYGLIKLTCDIGNVVGWMGWWYNTGENLVNQYFYVEGYPGDRAYGTMWWDGDYTTAQSARRLYYWIDTFNGESGSPVYHYNSVTPGLCGGWCITAIHTNGVGSSPYNSGTRFNPEVMSFINYWIGRP